MVSVREGLLRRLAGRFHIGEDILRHLSTFQRLGERFEVRAPTEMVPVGARTLARALRTRAAVQIRPDWLWPYWLERQLDPTDPAFVPRGHLPFLTNLTHRNWTAVGNVGSSWEAVVDPAGLVTTAADGWSVDWWVRHGDDWILPSRAAELRQTPEEAGTRITSRVGLADGGQVSADAYALRVDDREYVAVEVTSDRPVVVVFAVRPYNVEGLAVIETIKVNADAVEVDDGVGLLLPERPQWVAASIFHRGDCLHRFLAGTAEPFRPVRVRDPAGLAQAAVGYRLEPGAARRVLLPLPPAEPAPRAGTRVLDRPPTATETARQWIPFLDRGMRVRLPDDRLQDAVAANRTYLLVLHDPGSITAGPLTYHRFWFRDAAYQVTTLDHWGLHDEAADVIGGYPSRQHRDGFFYSQWHEWDANGAALFAIAEHYRLTGDRRWLAALLPSVRRAADWIGDKRRRQRPRTARGAGLLPAGVSAEHLGPYDRYYWDNFWCLRGLHDAAFLAEETGDAATARRWRGQAVEYRTAILRSIAEATRDRPEPYLPAGPNRGIDPGMIGSLVACYPLELLPATDPLVANTAELIRRRFTYGPAFFQSIAHSGLGTYLTAQLAYVELLTADQRAWQRLRWLLDAATSTFTWPEAIHPRTGGGCMGDGHHGWAAADFLGLVRAMVVRDTPDGDTALLSVLPAEWYGQDLEVRHAPVAGARLDYQLGWDGDRPVLAWSWHGPPRRLTAPGLDPTWSSLAADGEATFVPPVAAGRPRTPTLPA